MRILRAVVARALLILACFSWASAVALAQGPSPLSHLTAERLIRIHESLIWVANLNAEAGHVVRKEYDEAVAVFRAKTGSAEKGELQEAEIKELHALAKREADGVGFAAVDDPRTGLRIRLPLAVVEAMSTETRWKKGSEWSSADKAVQISSFRLTPSQHSISSWYRYWIDRLTPRVEYQQLLGDRFVVEGSYERPPPKGTAGKASRRQFHLRAYQIMGDVIGVMVEYDSSRANVMERVVNAIASRFEADNGWQTGFLRNCGKIPEEAKNKVLVIYATNRVPKAAPVQGAALALGDLFQAAQGDRLRIGCVEVGASASALERANHYLLLESKADEPGNLLAIVDDRSVVDFQDARTKRALLFVHGYNVSFADALARVAQIARDTGYKGNVFLFSWPSLGRWRAYGADLDQAERSEPYLESFIRMILSNPNVERLDVVAHSMGSQPTLRVLRLYSRALEDRGRSERRRRRGFGGLGQVIFAAPDVGRELFREQVRAIIPFADRITLYGSKADCALSGSRFVRDGAIRAGDTSMGPLVVDDVDTIEVPGTVANWLVERAKSLLGDRYWFLLGGYCNHSYFAERPAVLEDIGKLLKGSTLPPDGRAPNVILPDQTKDGRPYWRFKGP